MGPTCSKRLRRCSVKAKYRFNVTRLAPYLLTLLFLGCMLRTATEPNRCDDDKSPYLPGMLASEIPGIEQAPVVWILTSPGSISQAKSFSRPDGMSANIVIENGMVSVVQLLSGNCSIGPGIQINTTYSELCNAIPSASASMLNLRGYARLVEVCPNKYAAFAPGTGPPMSTDRVQWLELRVQPLY